jgi:hypothetical protein
MSLRQGKRFISVYKAVKTVKLCFKQGELVIIVYIMIKHVPVTSHS